ncbi:hypothetical protein B0T24DRAFT_672893 [Lasiosphaeria ovina]|uniref:BRCT domain-containing protein n=1 Tax=Lasiosphaeria ovina TaxID=92902 RepID=A0AAE0TXB2_9PEZI|nr:hypothetical protein B0T24DRAFT_672893 [Lasiosphaeria ovina]
MDPQSPPKRITRARAAAKAVEPATRTTRIVTAAAKAKAKTTTSATASTTSSANKRKTRSDDDGEESDNDGPPASTTMKAARATRGRAKKTADQSQTEPEPEQQAAPVKAPRGRPKKVVVPAAEEEPQAVKPARATRGRKAAGVADELETPAPAEPVKKTTRGRPPLGTATATAGTKSTAKPALKKTVKFEEPEKENIAPPNAGGRRGASTKTAATAGPESAATTTSGLRGKPVRSRAGTATGSKAAAAAGRSTRSNNATSSTVSQKKEKPIPLSPKKINQLALNRNTDSDDELAMDEKAPVRRFKKGPIKPPALGGASSSSTTRDRAPSAASASAPDEQDENLVLQPPEGTMVLGSPARRLPASPWKNSIKSPARRVEGLLGAPSAAAAAAAAVQANGQPAPSPAKMSLLQSPAKRQPLGGNMKMGGSIVGGGAQASASPLRMPLLSSPAKRPASPVKAAVAAHLSQPAAAVHDEGDRLGGRILVPKAAILATPRPAEQAYLLRAGGRAAEDGNDDDDDDDDDDEMVLGHGDDDEGGDGMPDSPTRLRFPGRLSAVLPRHADPALLLAGNSNLMVSLPEEQGQDHDEEDADAEEDGGGEPMALDHDEAADDDFVFSADVTPTKKASADDVFAQLREKDRRDAAAAYDDETESEEEEEEEETEDEYDDAAGADVPATPCPRATRAAAAVGGRTPASAAGRSAAKRVRVDGKFGFTPLADQLSGWSAGASPPKTASPSRGSFFDEAMADDQTKGQAEAEAGLTEDEEEQEDATPELDSPVLEDIPFSPEDVALAVEAHEMSLLEPEAVDQLVREHSEDESEHDERYGDENDVPIDPALESVAVAPLPRSQPRTPRAPLAARREVHTTSKIPLKPADDSTPPPLNRSVKKRSHSISRLPVQRPAAPQRSATVISYSPTRTNKRESLPQPHPVTPQKGSTEGSSWSTAGTPARTPRRDDVSPALLRGAVVFVDVHTTEGADASGIFVELLAAMGARCVKTWAWNPASSPPPSSSGSEAAAKIGITHVVYKDGGRRTLEKVRESAGVVQCVGVSWVLDCERENTWLDEAPYYIDTSLMPRGGARRRKSMEPRSIANLNGMLVPAGNPSATTPARQTSSSFKGSHTAPHPSAPAPRTPAYNRRASSLWVRTPEDRGHADDDADGSDDDKDDTDGEWRGMLTPVPKTPAPEAVARYAAALTPGSLSSLQSCDGEYEHGDDDDDDENDVDRRRAALMTRTCPPKASSSRVILGDGILARDKDQGVLMRLMAARRKSLQFAPKVGSPLAKAWN